MQHADETAAAADAGFRTRAKRISKRRRDTMQQEFLAIIVSVGETFTKNAPISIALAAVFTILSSFWACNPGYPWWRKREIVTDLCYWFFIPVVARFLRLGLLVAGTAIIFGITTSEGLVAFYAHGHGPLAGLPIAVQMVVCLIGEDVVLYWSHRCFHGARLWKYHAVHHSSDQLEWISAARFHPVDLMFEGVLASVVMIFAGISPSVLVLLAPFTLAHSAFVHANLDWTLGPFKYVIASPVFHRWHHTAPAAGGEKNFAGTFPVLDVIFGTFHMPPGELPASYGIKDRNFPASFGAQLVHPFTQ